MTVITQDGLFLCGLSRLLVSYYRLESIRNFVFRLARKLENGEFYSYTIREILYRYHGVRVGAYSYGPCLAPGAFPAGVTVGRYVSIANGVRVFLRNHPAKSLSLHPFFYNSKLGYLKEDTITSGTLEIGHDAWIGQNAMITTGCKRIGIGAIVGAGAVVTKDVADFSVVAGNPAKIIRSRFPDEVMEKIVASRWWERNIQEILPFMDSMVHPLENIETHPLLKK